MLKPPGAATAFLPLAGLCWAGLASAAGPGCPALTLGPDLAEAAARAEQAFAETRVEDFQAVTAELSVRVACLMEPVDPAGAARVHRLMGLRAFVERQPERAQQAFAAARSLQPEYAWPEELIPWGHPLLAMYQAIPVEGGTFTPLPAPAAGWVYLDGRPAEPRPSAWPALLQVSDAGGAIQLSAYLWPGEPLPAYPTARPPELARLPDPGSPAEEPVAVAAAVTSTTVRRGPRPWALATAGVAAAGAGALLALASHSADTYWDPATSTQDLDGLRRRTNGLVAASAAAGALGAGSCLVAFLSVRW